MALLGWPAAGLQASGCELQQRCAGVLVDADMLLGAVLQCKQLLAPCGGPLWIASSSSTALQNGKLISLGLGSPTFSLCDLVSSLHNLL